MIERTFIYMLEVLNVPVGGVSNVPLQLESDASFALRLVRSRNIGISGFRFQTPGKNWQSSGLRTDLNVDPILTGSADAFPGTPFPTRGLPVYPQMIYPNSGQILCDIGNNTGAPLAKAQLLFKGSKLYRDGTINAPTYPASGVNAKPFSYQVVVQNLAPSGPNATILNNTLQIKHDADFVIRSAVCDPFAIGQDGGLVAGAPIENLRPDPYYTNYQDVRVFVRDEGKKAYSNVPIPINDVFGQGFPYPGPARRPSETPPPFQDDKVLFFPGLFTPEIYLPREHSLYFDLYRDDSDFFAPINLWFRFVGAKVY